MDDLFAIQILKARYFRCIDTKDWDGFADLFLDDVEIDVTDDVPGGEVYRGRDRFVATCAEVLADAVTVHHGHMPELELVGPGRAVGVWAMEDYVEWPGRRAFRGYGHYHERYQKGDDGTWRIASMKLTRLRIDGI